MYSEDIYKMWRAIFDSIGLYKQKEIADAMSMSESNVSHTVRGHIKELACIEHVLHVISEINPDCLSKYSDKLKRAMIEHYGFSNSDINELEKAYFPNFAENRTEREAMEILTKYSLKCLDFLPKGQKRRAENDIYLALEILKQPKQPFLGDTQKSD